jgi:CBS domain-containing protein
MWITDPSPSPASSGPPTPSIHPATLSMSGPTPIAPPPIFTTSHPFVSPLTTQAVPTPTSPTATSPTPSQPTNTYNTPHLPSASPQHHSSISATSVPWTGGSLSGRLVGVVSLTDVLNLFAKASGLSPADPEATRKARRRSSSSSVRRSLEVLGLRGPSMDAGSR